MGRSLVVLMKEKIRFSDGSLVDPLFNYFRRNPSAFCRLMLEISLEVGFCMFVSVRGCVHGMSSIENLMITTRISNELLEICSDVVLSRWRLGPTHTQEVGEVYNGGLKDKVGINLMLSPYLCTCSCKGCSRYHELKGSTSENKI